MPYSSVLGSNPEKPLSYLKSAQSNWPCWEFSGKNRNS